VLKAWLCVILVLVVLVYLFTPSLRVWEAKVPEEPVVEAPTIRCTFTETEVVGTMLRLETCDFPEGVTVTLFANDEMIDQWLNKPVWGWYHTYHDDKFWEELEKKSEELNTLEQERLRGII